MLLVKNILGHKRFVLNRGIEPRLSILDRREEFLCDCSLMPQNNHALAYVSRAANDYSESKQSCLKFTSTASVFQSYTRCHDPRRIIRKTTPNHPKNFQPTLAYWLQISAPRLGSSCAGIGYQTTTHIITVRADHRSNPVQNSVSKMQERRSPPGNTLEFRPMGLRTLLHGTKRWHRASPRKQGRSIVASTHVDATILLCTGLS